MQAYEVRVAQQCNKVGRFHTRDKCEFRGQPGLIDHDAHVKRCGPLRHEPADQAEANDAQRLAGQPAV